MKSKRGKEGLLAAGLFHGCFWLITEQRARGLAT